MTRRHRGHLVVVLVAGMTLAGCSASPDSADVCGKATATLDQIVAVDRSADDPADAATLNTEITRLTSELRELNARGTVELAIEELGDAYALYAALTVESANGGDVKTELDEVGARVEAATQDLRAACDE